MAFKAALKLDPQSTAANFFLAYIYQQVRAYKEAETVLNQLVTGGASGPSIYCNLTYAHSHLGQLDKARKDAEQAVTLAPDLPAPYLWRASLLWYHFPKEHDKAIADVETAIDPAAGRALEEPPGPFSPSSPGMPPPLRR